MLNDSKVTFIGAFSWTPAGAELGRGTLNNEAFCFYVCGFSNFKILNPSASPQSSEVLFVRKRNDFCAGVTQCSWGPVWRIYLLKDIVLLHTFKQVQIRRDLTGWVSAFPHSSALMKYLTNHLSDSICGKFCLWIIHFWHRVWWGQYSKRQHVLSLQQCKLSVC